MLSHGRLLLLFSLVDVVSFSVAVVTTVAAVVAELPVVGHKERAAGKPLTSESP